MKQNLTTLILFIYCLWSLNGFSQDFPRYAQHNGSYTFTMIGNSLNKNENTNETDCTNYLDYPAGHVSEDTLTTGGKNIIAAYAVWSSNTRDNSITINGEAVEAETTYSFNFNGDYMYSQVSDATSIVQTQGDGKYEVTDLNTDRISVECGVSYGGWALIVVYEDDSLPKNSVNLYLGFEAISSYNNRVDVNINDLVIADTQGATLGIIAWEGDRGISNNETIRFDGNILSNSLNPSDNAFNGTNSFTGNNYLHNMDLDEYDISDYVIVADDYDTVISATSSQDLVLFNCFVFTLNNVLPEPTIEITSIEQPGCNVEELKTSFVVKNENANTSLPAGTEIKFYANDRNSAPIYETVTTTELPINGSETFTDVMLPFTQDSSDDVTIFATINLDTNGERIILELNPDNNVDSSVVEFLNDYETIEPIAEICEGDTYELVDGREVTKEGTYETEVTDPQGCTNTIIEEVVVNPLPVSSNAVLEECSSTTTATFTLSEANTTIINGDNTLTVDYFATLEEAKDATSTSTLADAYNSSATTIYARVMTDKGCLTTQEVELKIYKEPVENTVTDINKCDDDTDGIMTFDLTTKISEIYGSQDQTLFNVQLFTDASLTNEITTPSAYTNTTQTETIYYSIKNNSFDECTLVGSFEIIVNLPPNSTDAVLENCSVTPNTTFTLSNADSQINNGDSSLIVSYFETITQAEDLTNTNSLPNSYNTTSTVIYARVENEECYNVQELTLTVFQQPVLNTITNLEECDDDFDGVFVFDLTTKLNEIYGTQDTSLFDVQFYKDSNLTDEITNPSNYTNSVATETIYFSITNNTKADCTENGSFDIVLNEKPEANDVPISRVNCSNITTSTFNLTGIIDNIRNNDTTNDVVFYEDESLTNLITNATNYESETAIVYAKVINPNTGCYNIGEVELTVRQNPYQDDISATEQCSSNTDNDTAIFNLSPFTEQLVGTQDNVTITYHTTIADASSNTDGGDNPIINTTAYESKNAVIYARSQAEYNGTICFSVSEITLPVNERPIVNKIDKFEECSNTSSSIFDLSSKISEITNNESNRTVTFYDTEENAQTGGNNGLLNNNYSSSGETIYARVVNDITGCVSTTSLTLSVVTNPEITEEFNKYAYKVNGLASFDLDAYVLELQNNYPNLIFELHPSGSDLTDDTITPLTGIRAIDTSETLVLKYQLNTADCYQQTTYDLIVNEVPYRDQGDIVICLDQDYTLPNGEVVNETGEYIRTFVDPLLGYDVTVRTNLIIGDIHFPNAFAPNGNGYNEIFRGVPGEACVGEVENFVLEIYNRWGELVFSSTDFSLGWDGIFNGLPAQQGVYAWQATYTFKGVDEIKQGSVTLLR